MTVTVELEWVASHDGEPGPDETRFWLLDGLDFLADYCELCRIDELDDGYYVCLFVEDDDDGRLHEMFGLPFKTLEEAQQYAIKTLIKG